MIYIYIYSSFTDNIFHIVSRVCFTVPSLMTRVVVGLCLWVGDGGLEGGHQTVCVSFLQIS